MKHGIEKNLKATAQAFLAVREGYREGISSGELFGIFLREIRERLGDGGLQYDFLVGEDTAAIDGVSKDRVLRKGDVLLFDVSAEYGGKWCDVSRTFFVGEPSEEQREVFGAVKESVRRGEEALKDGATAGEIFAAAESAFVGRGKTLVHHAGHLVGALPLAEPQFVRGSGECVRSGDLVAIESGLYGTFGVRLENDYLVTDHGAENLFAPLMPLRIEEYILK